MTAPGTGEEASSKEPVSAGAVSREALAKQIVGRLLEMIRWRRLEPGDQLPPERKLATSMQVSRSSLREALRALAVMGVLEMRHGAGTYVGSLEPDVLIQQLGTMLSLSEVAFDQLFDARLAVEPAICAMAAENIGEQTLERLEACLRGAVEAVFDPETFLRLDLEIHTLICAAAGNALLSQFMASVHTLGLASRTETVHIPGQTERTIFDHELIVAALRARAPEAASSAMHSHLRRIQRDVQQRGHS
jgi:GntR family transcriptional repressor for pyruvate dehydrogenase complex